MASLAPAPIGENLTDLSIKALNSIFGTNWFTMEPEVTGSATIIVKMLTTVNELAMFVVTFLFAVTYLIAVVGTAHEGTPLGRKFHSFWVPVRFTLATGMLVPLKSGLCLFQLILLTTIGWSVHFANELWDVFLDSNAKDSIVRVLTDKDVPTPVRIQTEKVAGDVLANLVVYKYLESQYNLEGQDLAYQEINDTQNELHYTYQFRDPGSTINNNMAFGTVELMCHNLSSICEKQTKGVVKLIKDLEPVASALVARGVGDTKKVPSTQEFKNAVNRFSETQIAIIKQTYSEELNRLNEESKTFLEGAKELGWMGAGAYYHTIMGIQSKAAELSRINVTSSPPNALAKHDGFRQYENVLKLASFYDHESKKGYKQYVQIAKAGGSIGIIETIFGENLNVATVKQVANWMNEGDPIHAISKAGNYIIGAVDTAIATWGLLNSGSAGAKATKESSWFGSLLDGLVTQGTIGGFLAGFISLLSSLAPLFWMMIIALWSVAHIMAFYIPMVPFIYWMSGMIGWLMQTVEAMVTAPIWVVGHAMPEGEGLAGDRGRQGYMLLLAILLRPLLMLLGLCIAMVLMQIVGKLMGFMFTVYVASFESHTFVMPLHSLVAYLVILTSLMIIFTHKLFSLISYLPDNVLRWIGSHTTSMNEGADESKAHVMIGGLVSRAENAARGGVGAAGAKPMNATSKEKQGDKMAGTNDSPSGSEVSQGTRDLAPGNKQSTERGI